MPSRSRNFRLWPLLLFALVFAAQTAHAAFAPGTRARNPVKATLVALDESIQPGQPVTVALKLEHAPDWHTYWKNPGIGFPTSLAWTLPAGWSAGEIQWPVPKLIKDRQGSITGHGYDGIVYLPVTLTAPAGLEPGSQVTLRAKAEWLMCNDSCMPGNADVLVTLDVRATSPQATPLREKVLAAPPMVETPESLGWFIPAVGGNQNTIQLMIHSTGKGRLIPGQISDAHFFSSDGFVQYDKPQEIPAVLSNDFVSGGMAKWGASGMFGLNLPISKDCEGDGKRLTGVLAFTDTKGVYRGISIDVEIKNPNAAPANVAQTAKSAGLGGTGDSPVGSGGMADSAMLSEHGLAAHATTNQAVGTPASTISAALLLLAFLGGLILNLMPCVFPVLGIKILGFVNQAGASRRKITLHGIAFTAGVLVSFWTLAGLLAILRAGGGQLGWGFQLQSAPFVFILAALLLVFALSLSGVFEFGYSATSIGARLQDRGGYTGSFFTGVLATVVATPCSAPFLAPALGAALALPAGASFLVFTLIALGLSTPYLLLSIFPGAIKALPRPGAWMETFKQLMAFLLYATVAYLVWVLAAQAGESGFQLALFGLVLVAMAAWLYGRYAAPGNSPARRRFGIIGALALLACGLWLGWPRAASPTGIVWEKWSQQAVATARAGGKTVYVDFTARWCVTCDANKKLVFSSGDVRRVFREKQIVALKADWTNADPQITAELARFNRSAVPFNLIYKPGQPEPVILPELLTPGIVLDALK